MSHVADKSPSSEYLLAKKAGLLLARPIIPFHIKRWPKLEALLRSIHVVRLPFVPICVRKLKRFFLHFPDKGMCRVSEPLSGGPQNNTTEVFITSTHFTCTHAVNTYVILNLIAMLRAF